MAKINISKKELYTLYVVQKRSVRAIASYFNCSRDLIKLRLQKNKIKIRGYSESQKARFETMPESHGWRGKKHSKLQKKKWSQKRLGLFRGENSPSYKHGNWGGRWYRKFRKKECAYCKSVTQICLHHIDGNRFNNAPNNWITLCRKCHIKVHTAMGSYKKKNSLRMVRA